MRFYNRESELAELLEIRKQAFADHSRFTLITGRRRIGKTSLVLKSLSEEQFAYLFVGKKSEAVLCAEFSREINKVTGLEIPQELRTLQSLFSLFFQMIGTRKVTLFFDEFQELEQVNPGFMSDLQQFWDRNKEVTNVNLVASGSVYTLMKKLFEDKKEPLFGRADNIIKVAPFNVETLKQILLEHSPGYKNEDLLALYTITGGVPKYVELLCDNNVLTQKKMIDYIIRDNSPLLDEGKNLLVEEFGRNYSTYFSIITAISRGYNTQNEIESFVGKPNLGAQLLRLVEHYSILKHRRPIMAKEGSQTVRYEIDDPFIRFWFRFIENYRPLVEMKAFERLRKIVTDEFAAYSGKLLERYFKEMLAASGRYLDIGSYWEARNREQNEIDIVAIESHKPKLALAAEVKRNPKEFRPIKLDAKVEHLEQKLLYGYQIERLCLSLNDM
ncbi:MAG: ATP-binding protein [Coriobacteriia bacterium]|nr:ATP-binding protein [Coriobacteriia bacterium]